MWKKSIQVGLAYVGIIVGAGLSSGQDLMQYFISFGKMGLVGVVLLAVLNIIFGRIIIALGCFYQSNSHDEVLEQIATPFTKRVLDASLVISGFVIGFVMLAGAGSNLQQQFGIPSWLGALLCAGLIIGMSFLDFDRITKVLGVFTPIIILMIVGITAWTFIGKSYDYARMDAIAQTLPSPMPNVWLSVINYYALCAMTGVSMAFVLGGSLIRIRVAKRAGVIGGALVGIIIVCATCTLFARINVVKDSDIPMLELVQRVSPVLAIVYALIIFALIFNTAFSLYYSMARRVAGTSKKKLVMTVSALVAAGYMLSFFGFKQLISVMYPILGYLGIVMLVVLLYGWLSNLRAIQREQRTRTTMIRIMHRKFDEDTPYTEQDRAAYDELGQQSVVDTETIKQGIHDTVKQEHENNS